ncbi:MAG: hypothetical protein AAF840_05895 [Bacteroidota bacterium]
MSQVKTAADLIGLTLYARKRIPKMRWPEDDAPVLGFVGPGQRIGVVRSWINQKPGSRFWYWEFDDLSRGQFATFYVPHDPARLNLPRLQEDMQARDEATRRRQLEWWERVVEDGTNAVQVGANQVYTGALLLGGLYLITKALIK